MRRERRIASRRLPKKPSRPAASITTSASANGSPGRTAAGAASRAGGAVITRITVPPTLRVAATTVDMAAASAADAAGPPGSGPTTSTAVPRRIEVAVPRPRVRRGGRDVHGAGPVLDRADGRAHGQFARSPTTPWTK